MSVLNQIQQTLQANANTKMVTGVSMSGDAALKQQIMDIVFPINTRSKKAGFNAGAMTIIVDALNNGFIDSYSGSNINDCSKARQNPNASALGIASQSANYGVQGLGLLSALKVVNVVPVVGQIVGAAVQVFQEILHLFGQHSQAVANEQTILCSIIPAVNSSIAQLDKAVAYGQISGTDAANAINQILASYESTVRPIIKNNPGQCNAACDVDRAIRALLMFKSAKYAQIYAGIATDLVDVSGNISSTLASNPIGGLFNPITLIGGLLLLLFL